MSEEFSYLDALRETALKHELEKTMRAVDTAAGMGHFTVKVLPLRQETILELEKLKLKVEASTFSTSKEKCHLISWR